LAYRSNLWREGASHVPPMDHTTENRNNGTMDLVALSLLEPPVGEREEA
jgi:hypothetical protein